MDGPHLFRELKHHILAAYARHYPFFQGGWATFSSKDIRQLIDLVEETQKERVSEKWVYTHLKPETAAKLPRKDMLDIFSRFAGYSGWDEFCHIHRTEQDGLPLPINTGSPARKTYVIGLFIFIALIAAGVTAWFIIEREESRTLEIKDRYTGRPVDNDDVKVYTVSEGTKTPVEVQGSKVTVSGAEKLVIESPYYKKQEVTVSETGNAILINPEDYALVLKAFILSDVKDWETRKEQLAKILSDDLEVIVMLKDGLGAEYLNKEDFSQKLILPTAETKKMKIITLETDDDRKITFIRIEQL